MAAGELPHRATYAGTKGYLVTFTRTQLHHLSLAAPGRLDRLDRSLHEHERLLTAYADRDAPLAVAITRSIVNAGYQAIATSERHGE
jgi:DNA-binding GntR family transcriptional regulator